MIEALDIHVSGIVQGVGFRPFIYRLAKRYLVNGWVLNAVDGVHIHAEGDGKLLDEFILEISENAPASAQVKQIDIKEVPLQDFNTFEIRFSDEQEVDQTTLVSPDLATCEDCVRELFDPADRRYRYPFINCTNCGPRFTIIRQLPYDRPATSMAQFPMCESCAHEYADPADRRFHAQPDACFECGPSLCFAELTGASDGAVSWSWGSTREQSDGLIERTVQLLREGRIMAVKGLGGFHLVCDAANPQALAALRERKRRPRKPFAVMVRDIEQAHRYCHVSIEEEALLANPARPIVLLRMKSDAQVEQGVTCGLSELGIMLPATPVQHLIVRAFGGMLVMTSGNVHDEPIQIDDEQACTALAGIADAVLGNNRAILNRYDDSVVRVLDVGEGTTVVQSIRRARGFAPVPLIAPLPEHAPLLAVGAEQKNTFCLMRGSEAFVSQHMGDMEDARVQDAWLQSLDTYQRLFEIQPQLLACDMHPEYLASKWAHAQQLPVVEVQHHHAHIASVIAENNIEGAVCGFAFDGTGYGVDGAIWGGEVLLANVQAFERFANFAYVPLPGGAAAISDPRRCAYGILWAFDLLEHPAAADLLEAMGELAPVCEQMIDQSLNCPYTSSVGRLFDAASALLGVCDQASYEGEPAIMLEAVLPSELADSSEACASSGCSASYAIEMIKNTATQDSTAQDTSVVLLDPAPAFRALLDDKQAAVPVPVIAQRFHDAFVDAIVQVAQIVEGGFGISTVALSGGVFMNRYLAEHAVRRLSEAGLTVALNKELPPNDGCISYGQATVACHA